MKYDIPRHEGEDLPNKLGLTDNHEIGLAESVGFEAAESQLVEMLTMETVFDAEYICEIHRLALGHIYEFAGRYRRVNLAKGGFSFSPAANLIESMRLLDTNFLSKIQDRIWGQVELRDLLADIHAELLFIHPFREGNGRTARLLNRLVCFQQDIPRPNEAVFLSEGKYNDDYIRAVQRAAVEDYEPMRNLFRLVLPL